MTAEQWKTYGYDVIEEEGFVYLIRELHGVGYVTAEAHGDWTKHENVNRLPWRFIDLRNYPRILEIARNKSLQKCA